MTRPQPGQKVRAIRRMTNLSSDFHMNSPFTYGWQICWFTWLREPPEYALPKRGEDYRGVWLELYVWIPIRIGRHW